ncbi:hypothetical protein ABD86_14050 [Paenibacillus alvei]|nr:hypothetical protein [Paenibacillus alvei]
MFYEMQQYAGEKCLAGTNTVHDEERITILLLQYYVLCFVYCSIHNYFMFFLIGDPFPKGKHKC